MATPKRPKFLETKEAAEIRDAVAGRLAEVDTTESVLRRSTGAQQIVDGFKSLGFNEELLFSVLTLKGSLAIDPNSLDQQPLADLFAFMRLDSNKPLHWRLLLEEVLAVAFRGAGAPEVWSEAKFHELDQDIQALATKMPHLKTHRAIAIQLLRQKDSAKRYKTESPDYLRKRISMARNPAYNSFGAVPPGASRGDAILDREAGRRTAQVSAQMFLLRQRLKIALDEIGDAIADRADLSIEPWTTEQLDYILLLVLRDLDVG